MALALPLLPPELGLAIDSRVFGFAAALGLAASAVFALPSALEFTRSDQLSDLRGGKQIGHRLAWLRRVLLGAQVGVSLMLVAGAGLLVRSLHRAAAVDLGFDPGRVLAYAPGLELAGYDDARAGAFYRRLAERMAVLPGVQSVSLALDPPVNPGFLASSREIVVEGQAGAAGPPPRVAYNAIGVHYLRTLDVPVLEGRDFSEADRADAPRVALVNQRMARRFWPAGHAIGRRIRFGSAFGLTDPVEVVGIVGDTRIQALDPPQAEVLVPFAQDFRRDAVLLFRTDPEAGGLESVLRREVAGLDANLPPASLESLASRVAGATSDTRLYGVLASLFGGVGILLAAIGLYGTLAYSVSRRTREIGIRMALGASRRHLVWMVLREGAAVTAGGVALGLAGGLALARVLAGQLYGVSPSDPLSFAAAALVVGGAAGVASWLPARRAMAVEALAALRQE
jgi:predicted permease